MTQKHTPTPWNFHVGDDYIAILKHKNKTDDLGIAMIGYPSAGNLANAAFIVNAVNMHDKLVATVENILEWMEGEGNNTTAIDDAFAVLAECKGDA